MHWLIWFWKACIMQWSSCWMVISELVLQSWELNTSLVMILGSWAFSSAANAFTLDFSVNFVSFSKAVSALLCSFSHFLSKAVLSVNLCLSKCYFFCTFSTDRRHKFWWEGQSIDSAWIEEVTNPHTSFCYGREETVLGSKQRYSNL